MANRLASQTSPYLQQHAANPVDWYPWGPEALERARREDKPILLSVGYSACHWCHVMAHESFEDPAVAAVMNRLFVNVKVDREERPDLDQIYQSAHQMLAQRPGGWPLTMFLSPDGTPFFGGTYFPRAARFGLPGFPELCERIAALWRDKQPDIARQNSEVQKALARTLPRRPSRRPELSRDLLRAVLDSLRASFDPRFGGFGAAPKFPHPTDLELCLRKGETDIAHTTLKRMCEGGIYDQLGGGFSRYSVDAQWMIPHFEKMLYDNGPLLSLLADAWLVTGERLYARCAEETAGWIMREMQSPEGGYYSSLDADSEHEEGKFYVWSRDEAQAALTGEEYAVLSPHFGLDQPPNFENRHWHLHVARPVEPGKEGILERAKQKLFAARAKRVRPGRDEKVLVSWNALAIRGMAHAGRVLGREPWIASARRALEFIRSRMWRDGRLLATSKDGHAHLAAYLDDYAYLMAALIELLQSEFSLQDLEFAEQLAEVLLAQFEDAEGGGFFFTARDHEALIHRPKPGYDNATPSGNAVAAWGLGRLAALTGEQRYAAAAERTLELFYPMMRDSPAGYGAMTIALDEHLQPPGVLVLRGKPEPLAGWQAELAREFLPDTTVLAIADSMSGLPPALDKPARPEPVNGWLCRGVNCLLPISDLVDLRKTLREKP
ncbi:MAG: thioredoxin domain-containing protein [Betaproteobacteria bacterium]|nr:MAG: thioredoxin domain-containing protein [Betaproteobacteria bacterium]